MRGLKVVGVPHDMTKVLLFIEFEFVYVRFDLLLLFKSVDLLDLPFYV